MILSWIFFNTAILPKMINFSLRQNTELDGLALIAFLRKTT